MSAITIPDDPSVIQPTIERLRRNFTTGQTRDVLFRKQQLQNLLKGVKDLEKQIEEGLIKDLHHSKETAYLFSFAGTLNTIHEYIDKLEEWSKPRYVKTPLILKPAQSYVVPEPLGVALVIGAWNFPLVVTLLPAVAAIAAGNAVVVKPSEMSPHTSRAMRDLFEKYLDPRFYAVIEGQVEVAKAIIKQRFDLIIFTGGTEKGKIVARAAAEHLTPCILELGGKSPCIVDADTEIELAAIRIANGRFANAGQTCIAVDYVLVHKSIKDKLVAAVQRHITKLWGTNPQESKDYQRIISNSHVDRIKRLLDDSHGGKVVCGGVVDVADRFIAPTIIDGPTPDSGMMKEEIFGPVLPVLTYQTIDEAIQFVNERDKPLALYFFGGEKNYKRLLKETSSGTISRNDAITFIVNSHLPFGGVGNSGMSKLHGKFGFDNCSHLKACFEKTKMASGSIAEATFPPYKPEMIKILRRLDGPLRTIDNISLIKIWWLIVILLVVFGASQGYLDDYITFAKGQLVKLAFAFQGNHPKAAVQTEDL